MRSDYELRGGRQPDVAAITNVLAHQGVHAPNGEPLGEALLFTVSGGIGAGYLLREFAHDAASALVLGFRAQWQSPQAWLKSTVDRLGLAAGVHTTGGRRGAAKRLTAELAEGKPVLVLPDRYSLRYWHLPKSADGGGAHLVVAYGEEGGRVLVDDRNLAPLTVERKAFDAARDQVRSDKNLLVSVQPGEVKDLNASVRAGLADCAHRLSGNSTSFSLPAWNRWAKQLTDERSPQGWPTVFAERRGLIGTLLTIWANVTPAGMTGGHLRDLFAEGLDEAGALLEVPKLAQQAEKWRDIAAMWDDLAETALSKGIPEFAWLRGLIVAVSSGVRAGDEGREAAAGSAGELWRLRAHYDTEAPFTDKEVGDLFIALGTQLRTIHAAELDAIGELAVTFPG
jgi:HPt (histidine-containing phosphotransfer) domain-containing protein